MTKVFITGGAGYVGAVLTLYLLDKGYKVKVLDLMIYGEKVLQEHKNLKILKGDIRDLKLMNLKIAMCLFISHVSQMTQVLS